MVDPIIVGSAISAGSSLLGGILGSSSAKDQAKQDWKHQLHMAQNQVQYRVSDARKAGISPLAALGVNPISVSPSYVGNSDLGIGEAGRALGQGISQIKTSDEKRLDRIRIDQEEEKLKQLKLENVGLATEYLKQNQSPSQPVVGPTAFEKQYGITGQDVGSKIYEEDLPPEFLNYTPVLGDIFEYQMPTKTRSMAPGIEEGVGPMYQYRLGEGNYLTRLLTADAAEPLDTSWYDNLKEEFKKAYKDVRNALIYMGGNGVSKETLDLIRADMPKVRIPPGWDLRYDPWATKWKLVRDDGKNLLFYNAGAKFNKIKK